MPLTRKKKEAIVSNLAEASRGASATIFADFFGLKTKDMNELRKTVKALGGRVQVVKKTFVRRGFADAAQEEILTKPGGVAAIWFRSDDIPSALKAVWQFSKTNGALKILGGHSLAFGGVMSAEQVLTLAKLPAREVLLAQLVGMLNSPISGLVRVLDAISKTRK